MRLFCKIAILLALATQWAPPALAKTCIDIREIASSAPARDGKSITFTMKNGRILRNDLQGACPDLDFDGFAWTFRNSTTVCDAEQSIRVIQTGAICKLGKFSEVSAGRK